MLYKLFPELLHNWTQEFAHQGKFSIPRACGIADTTLRDGEQMPGIYFTLDEKLEYLDLVSKAGFIGVEVGYPAVAKEEEEACKQIAESFGRKLIPVAMCRMVKSDIDAVLRTGIRVVDIFTSVSDLKMIYHLKLGKSPEEARRANLEMVTEHTQYARDHGLRMAFGIEDASRADLDYLAKLINTFHDVARHLATSTGPADTTGFFTPLTAFHWAQELTKRIKLPVIMHCHNDYGMATANSLAGWQGGASGISGTICGIGERCGNAPLEEVIMALHVIYGVKTTIKLEYLPEICRFVELKSGIPIHVLKPILGDNAFKHESGIHASGALVDPAQEVEGAYQGVVYESVPKHLLGIKQSKYVFGKFSGSKVLKEVALKPMGIPEIPDQTLSRVIERIKTEIHRKSKQRMAQFIKDYHDYIDWLGLSVQEVKEIVEEEMKQFPAS